VLHNAGLLGDVCPMDRQTGVWQQVMQVNVNGTFMLTQALLPLLLKSESGSLVFTSSSVGRQGRANWGAYAASKFATEGMMQVLAESIRAVICGLTASTPAARAPKCAPMRSRRKIRKN
jgi:NAD(P)-dependent dehydrogenase (short-subunit alcohol dehydrogenase family)